MTELGNFVRKNGAWELAEPVSVTGNFYLHVELGNPGYIRVWQRPDVEGADFFPSAGAAWENTTGCSCLVKNDYDGALVIKVTCSEEPKLAYYDN